MRRFSLLLVLSFCTLWVTAQIGAGQWKIHPYFVGVKATNCVDATNKVYYLAGGSLYCYDKAGNSNQVLDMSGALNDMNISQIYYNFDNDYLVVTYDNCNIDIIQPDGTVVNIPAIKDVVLTKGKTINDVTFAPGKIYVATSFGYIVINDSSFTVDEVRYYTIGVRSLAVIGGTKVMSFSNVFIYCDQSKPVEVDSWHKQAPNAAGQGQIIPINDNRFFVVSDRGLYVANIVRSRDDSGNLICTFPEEQIIDVRPVTLQRTPSGFVASFFSNNYYYTFDADGSNPVRHDGNEIYSSHEQGSWWALGTEGLSHIVNGVRGETIEPKGISIVDRAYWTTYDPFQQRILLCRTAENRILDIWDSTTNTEINSYDGSQWHNITPPNIGNYGGNYKIVVSPNEPNTYFYCSRKEGGVAKVQNDSVVVRYYSGNSNVSYRAAILAFDSKGNLWITQPYYSDNSPEVLIVTPEKQALNNITKADVIVNNLGGVIKNYNDGFKRSCFDIGGDDIKVYSGGEYDGRLIIWNNNDDLSLKQYKAFSSFNDQDNREFTTHSWVYVKADKEGMIWIGTAAGVISLDPRHAFDDDFRINRMAVTLREGKRLEMPETLLEGIQVNCIDVDAENRKWLATNTSGVYLVSADGSEIIKHFDMSNSPLPSDQIYSVCCNPSTNSVLVVTARGVVEYFSDITPSASNYDKVYAYPNPVHPDFTGYITITGLMDNSYVVITDNKGTVVKSIVSTGGVAVWSGCDSNGNRLQTGTYRVYAAQGHNPDTNGRPVARIVMIK